MRCFCCDSNRDVTLDQKTNRYYCNKCMEIILQTLDNSKPRIKSDEDDLFLEDIEELDEDFDEDFLDIEEDLSYTYRDSDSYDEDA